MRAWARLRITDCFLLLAVVTVCGCEPSDPPEALNRDLGESGKTLLPVSEPTKDPAVRSGSADWYDFEPVDPAEMPSAGATDDSPDAALVAEVRELIEEMNEVALAGDFDELVGYFVEDEQGAAKEMLDLALSMKPKIAELETMMREKLPEEGDLITSVFDAMTADSSGTIDPLTITVKSPTEVVITEEAQAGLPNTTSFLLIDNEWYVSSPVTADINLYRPIIQMAIAGFDGMMAMVKAADATMAKAMLVGMAASTQATPPAADGEKVVEE